MQRISDRGFGGTFEFLSSPGYYRLTADLKKTGELPGRKLPGLLQVLSMQQRESGNFAAAVELIIVTLSNLRIYVRAALLHSRSKKCNLR